MVWTFPAKPQFAQNQRLAFCPAGLLLDHCCTAAGLATAHDITDSDFDEIAATKFVDDGQIKERSITQLPQFIEIGANSPNVAQLQRAFGPYGLSGIPWESLVNSGVKIRKPDDTFPLVGMANRLLMRPKFKEPSQLRLLSFLPRLSGISVKRTKPSGFNSGNIRWSAYRNTAYHSCRSGQSAIPALGITAHHTISNGLRVGYESRPPGPIARPRTRALNIVAPKRWPALRAV